LHRVLLRRLAAGTADGLDVEDLVLRLLDAALGAAYRPAAPRRRTRADTLAAHREKVEAAKLFLAAHPDEPLALAGVAKAVHASPFHLTRLFTRWAGISLVRYRNRLRLRRGLDLLAESPRDLTAVALAAGFADHSHFTNAFRREFGVPPSRADHHPRALAELSKNLQA
jgi:transcriptional regulator GlxA family with amidase domain